MGGRVERVKKKRQGGSKDEGGVWSREGRKVKAYSILEDWGIYVRQGGGRGGWERRDEEKVKARFS